MSPGAAPGFARIAGGILLAGWLAAGAASASGFPPSPWDILRSRELATPMLDAVDFCTPGGLDPAVDPILDRARVGEWEEARTILGRWMSGLDRAGPELHALDEILEARAASDRADRLAAESRLADRLGDREFAPQGLCLRLERARLLMLLDRHAEASAQLTVAERDAQAAGLEDRARTAISFGRAEILYLTGRRFDAHLAFRELAKSEDPRIAAAARLRLTDLSFDAGKTDRVSVEYEALLPRAGAFGGSSDGWALRASEAALDAGRPERALRWLERFSESRPARSARDTAEIRLADLDVHFGDPLRARKRLAAVSGRRRGDALGALAAVRQIDLGVSAGSPGQRLDVLLRVLREQRRGVRRYALGVLMTELERRGDYVGALAVATRLAYEGVDPVVTPDYTNRLGALLERVAGPESELECSDVLRALGGRYGILIERAERPGPFVRVGLCFEELELPWLAVTVYRSVSRRFGLVGAQAVTLPLARSSLAIGETTLAQRAATAALQDPGPERDAWRAVLAEADFAEGRLEEAAAGLRASLGVEPLPPDRAKLLRLLALSFEGREAVDDVRFVSSRAETWLDEPGALPAARVALLEAALLAAHAHRRAGRIDEARPLYRVVERSAPPGAFRSSARFWLGWPAPARDPSSGVVAAPGTWGEDPDVALGSPWGGLARFERAFVGLRDAYAEAAR